MTPMERLQAAIEKLERLRVGCTPGEWWVTPGGGESWVFAGPGTADDVMVIGDARLPQDTELIATLHRTIDAQIAILREALFQLEGAPARAGFIGNEFNLFMRLADAILGSDQ